jgi:hypothetical protein
MAGAPGSRRLPKRIVAATIARAISWTAGVGVTAPRSTGPRRGRAGDPDRTVS